MIVIRLDYKTALLLAAGVTVLCMNAYQVYALCGSMYQLIRSIHWSLVQAPLEAAINSAKAALDERPGD